MTGIPVGGLPTPLPLGLSQGVMTATLSTSNNVIAGPISMFGGGAAASPVFTVNGSLSFTNNVGLGGSGFTRDPNDVLLPTDTIVPADGAPNPSSLVDNNLSTVFSTNAATETLTVTPVNGPTILTGIAISNANNSSSPGTSDPQSFLVQGSNDGGATFTNITPTAVSIPPFTAQGQTQTFTIVNATTYTTYRVILTSSNQSKLELSELQLIGTISPTPTPTPLPIVFGTGQVNTGPVGTGAAPTTAINTSSGPTVAGVL